MVTTVSARDFNHDVSAAKRAAEAGPVVITDRGTPSHVLLTYAEYRRLQGPRRNIADLLYAPETVHVEFAPERIGAELRPVDL